MYCGMLGVEFSLSCGGSICSGSSVVRVLVSEMLANVVGTLAVVLGVVLAVMLAVGSAVGMVAGSASDADMLSAAVDEMVFDEEAVLVACGSIRWKRRLIRLVG